MNQFEEAIKLVYEERQRQINVLGWSPKHDDSHLKGQLLEAAHAYRIAANLLKEEYTLKKIQREFSKKWPFEEKLLKNSETPLRLYVKEGALITAEMQRLIRVNAKNLYYREFEILKQLLDNCYENITESLSSQPEIVATPAANSLNFTLKILESSLDQTILAVVKDLRTKSYAAIEEARFNGR